MTRFLRMKRLWKNIRRFFYLCEQRVEADCRVKRKRICHVWLKPRRRPLKVATLQSLQNDLAGLKKSVQKELAGQRELLQRLACDSIFSRFSSQYRRPVDAEKHFGLHLGLCVIPPAHFGCNLGDHIQGQALARLLRELLPGVAFSSAYRDELSLYQGDPAFCVMQGWFARGWHFFPNERIWPVFIGFHLTRHMQQTVLQFLQYNPRYLEQRSIGCRDRQTERFFRRLGVDAYFSRCFTLTFPRREEKETQKKVFMVDMRPELQNYVPAELREVAECIEQRCLWDAENEREYYRNPLWREEQEARAAALLERYRDEAALVITGAVHCASPCTALGIPVVFITPNGHDARVRADFLEGIIPVYMPDDLKAGRVDWAPTAPDIEPLKDMIRENLRLTLEHERRGGGEPTEEMRRVREAIANFRVLPPKADNGAEAHS